MTNLLIMNSQFFKLVELSAEFGQSVFGCVALRVAPPFHGFMTKECQQPMEPFVIRAAFLNKAQDKGSHSLPVYGVFFNPFTSPIG
ncbi:MAG: hypothetical protein HKP13_05355 [Gammaproteobacteria bacterium]|nr:hypothetical protein [Gammaproteobacteria bacterium]